MSTPMYIPPGQGRVLDGPGGDRFVMKLTAGASGDQVSVSEYEVPPGAGPPLHVHSREDESFWILEGTVSYFCGGKTFDAGPGSFVWAPRGVAHAFKNRGTTRARFILLVTPPRNFEEFYAKITAGGASGPPSDAEVVERIMRFAPEHGIEILGPSPL